MFDAGARDLVDRTLAVQHQYPEVSDWEKEVMVARSLKNKIGGECGRHDGNNILYRNTRDQQDNEPQRDQEGGDKLGSVGGDYVFIRA